MTPEEFAAIEALAALAREDTFRPGWPFGGTGEWTENLMGLLGGPVGDFVGAVSPDVVVGLIAAVRERDNTIARAEAAVASAALKVLADFDTVMNVRAEVAYIVAEYNRALRAALDPQETL